MKIGIVTWYDLGYNYGSTLQAFALQKTIDRLGYQSYFLNYKPEKRNLMKRLKRILLKFYLLLFKQPVYQSYCKMDRWILKNLRIEKEWTKYEDLVSGAKQYEAIVCGSDQIWNNSDPSKNDFYFLKFADKKKRVSYAPSIARETIPLKDQQMYYDYIMEIPKLSIREEKGASLIYQLTGRKAKVVIDPTLLLEAEIWKEVASKSLKKFKKPYLLIYFLSPHLEIERELEQFARKKGIEVRYIPLLQNFHGQSDPLDHADFLNEIKEATYVATDSFHGTIFSILFQRSFVTYKRFADTNKQNQNSRIFHLLNKLALENHLMTSETTLTDILEIPITATTFQRIEVLREDSINYLKDALLKKE